MAKANLSERIQALLAQAERFTGLPNGTMSSIMQQEVGAGAGRFLQDPSAYHYAKNAQGQRVAGHTGKISTAFGPFGILESTAAKPGYGVKPLANKTIEEQVRFASEYLAARSKNGGLEKGLSGYGEGARYASQVAGRIPGRQPVAITAASVQSPMLARVAPERLAQLLPPASYAPVVQTPQTQVAAVQSPQAPVQAPPELVAMARARQAMPPVADRSWRDFQEAMPSQAIQPIDLEYGTRLAMAATSTAPNFQRFGKWGTKNL